MIKRPTLLMILIIMSIVNALVASLYFVLVFTGVFLIKSKYPLNEFAVAGFLVAIIPAFIGGHGIWRLKRWGLPFSFLANGGYFYGIIFLITGVVLNSSFDVFMSFVYIYYLLFSLIFVVYLIRNQSLFN
jgi:hypothetical protein